VKLLLDTHAFLWWLEGNERLPPHSREHIGDPETRVYVSAASAWEICTKVRLGKLPGAAAVADDVSGCVHRQAFTPLDISIAHAQRAGRLPGPHRDPFDRMLVAQALSLDVAIVSNERLFDRWGVRRVWQEPV
jgi:PIN domain nuclease of toxin-antitoxin system